MNKLSLIGIIITFIYFSIIASLIWTNLESFSALEPNAWGDFLAGALGPVAIFWVILGFFQQGRELRFSVEALRMQAEELKNSVEQQKSQVDFSKRQLEFDQKTQEYQKARNLSKDLPFIHMALSEAGSFETSGFYSQEEFFTVVFNIKNFGAPSVDTFIDIGEGFFCDRFIGPLSAGGECFWQVKISAKKFNQLCWETIIAVESKNARNLARVQTFRIGSIQPKLLETKPPHLE